MISFFLSGTLFQDEVFREAVGDLVGLLAAFFCFGAFLVGGTISLLAGGRFRVRFLKKYCLS